nr:hypothetical protein [Pseudomonas luteola]
MFLRLPAQPINKIVDGVLTRLGNTVPVRAGSKEFHQALARRAANLVGSYYSETAKEKARKDCISHLRASLAKSGATDKSQYLNKAQQA